MAKGFTITPGLENMGAMKTGGQGSVYRGRRIGEIITAIKLLPTPISSQSVDDRNFQDFQNEVQKLKKVNEEANPNVVKILSSGLSETGNFPFIEMEYVEGPDLQELLKPPHAPVFPVKEVVKVAEHLSSALAHCHKKEIKHGDIKSNNVKYNVRSGNYVLLDFGLAVMSEEQRRTSLRHAGAVEFMAPEQNEGEMLFQTDVYGFGVVMFELLAGTVPFPLNEKGVTARNNVKLAHLETPPPDVLLLRQEKMPAGWAPEKAEKEAHVPRWIADMIYKCLEKKPENRFTNGVELHEFIQVNRTYSKIRDEQGHIYVVKGDDETFKKEKEKLQEQVFKYKQEIEDTENKIAQLADAVKSREDEAVLKEKKVSVDPPVSSRKVVSYNSFIVLLFLAVALAVFSAFSLFRTSKAPNPEDRISAVEFSDSTVTDVYPDANDRKNNIEEIPAKTKTNPERTEKPVVLKPVKELVQKPGTEDETKISSANNATGKYKVISVAYFYNRPQEGTQRKAFINHWNNALLTPLDEMNGFIYIVFKNHLGQISKGWIRKKDLKPVDG